MGLDKEVTCVAVEVLLHSCLLADRSKHEYHYKQLELQRDTQLRGCVGPIELDRHVRLRRVQERTASGDASTEVAVHFSNHAAPQRASQFYDIYSELKRAPVFTTQRLQAFHLEVENVPSARKDIPFET